MHVGMVNFFKYILFKIKIIILKIKYLLILTHCDLNKIVQQRKFYAFIFSIIIIIMRRVCTKSETILSLIYIYKIDYYYHFMCHGDYQNKKLHISHIVNLHPKSLNKIIH